MDVSTKQLRYWCGLMREYGLLRMKIGDVELISAPQVQAVRPPSPPKEGAPLPKSIEELVSESPAFERFERTGAV